MEQNWTPDFTKRAIAEYRRFLFLCCISPGGAAPSQPVDEVWHQHLTYTRSYWVDLCQGVLGRELHHFPSAGGPAEDAKHRQWYSDTLAFYRDIFDGEPPEDLWPSAMKTKPLPDLPRFNWKSPPGAGVALLMVIPFIFSGIAYGSLSPFALGAPHFLVFFGVYAAALIGSLVIVRLAVQSAMAPLIDESFPADLSPFQVADSLYGKHRAVQTGIVDLIQRNLLEVSASKRFRVMKGGYIPRHLESNPLIPGFADEEEGSLLSYDDIANRWYARERFSHPGLTALAGLSTQKEPFLQGTVFLIAFYGMALARLLQGFLNGRPVGYLFFMTFALTIVGAAVWQALSRQSIIRRRVKTLYEQQLAEYGDLDRTVPLFVLEGNSAIAGFAEGVLLTSVFAAVRPAKGDGGMMGDSGSSCSSGSGCGGGGSSGCGGCSGN